MTQEQKKILESAIKVFGVMRQTDKAIEEMAELTQALKKFRYPEKNLHILHNDVISELADVVITVNQLIMMYDTNNDLDRMIEFKLDYLSRKIESARNGEKTAEKADKEQYKTISDATEVLTELLDRMRSEGKDLTYIDKKTTASGAILTENHKYTPNMIESIARSLYEIGKGEL